MSHAFISYVSENTVLVDQLREDLQKAGVKVWRDRNDIKPGQWWEDAVNEAIEKGAFFIACFSKEFNARRETYMHDELRVAIDILRKMPRNRVWFIPVLLNKTQIPSHHISGHEDLKDIQAVKLFDNWNEGIIRILQAMKLEDPDYKRVLYLLNSLKYHPVDRHHTVKELVRMGVALGKIGPAAAEAVPALIEALRDPDRHVREHAAAALGMIGPAAVPTLTNALHDPDRDVREHAAEALGKIGPAAAEAVPALIEALRDPDRHVRWHAAEALEKIGPAAVPTLTDALHDPDRDVRWHAAEALGKLGPAAAEAVPALTEALHDPDRDVRWHAAEALEKIGPAAAEAVPALTDALHDTLTGMCAGTPPRRLGSSARPLLRPCLPSPRPSATPIVASRCPLGFC